jgi:hypothetical protein
VLMFALVLVESEGKVCFGYPGSAWRAYGVLGLHGV